MLRHTKQIKGIQHPQINEMFIRQKKGMFGISKDILVIETNIPMELNKVEKKHENDLEDLLIDLPHLKEQAEQQIGQIDSVHIRSYKN